jgi:hypothetical protein
VWSPLHVSNTSLLGWQVSSVTYFLSHLSQQRAVGLGFPDQRPHEHVELARIFVRNPPDSYPFNLTINLTVSGIRG